MSTTANPNPNPNVKILVWDAPVRVYRWLLALTLGMGGTGW
ncbi:hypothetical protein [Rhodoferax sp.]|nr:hypothetical protein [Rhodoferax sp.]